MSRTTERARSSFYRAGGLPRVASMIGLLIVLGVLIGRSADPNSWAWLAGEGKAPAEPDLNSKATARREPRPPETKVTTGPTDTDAEERAGAAEEYQALTDGTLALAKEEMPAYWRLFRWVEHQSLADLSQRSDRTAVLNQFLQTADEQRGKLFQFDLNVRRVLSYDAPANSAGITKVYEVTGWTTESKAWLYVVLTAHLPEGMPIGPDVNERVSFAGYFLKVQGYHAAGAGPRDKPLAAPLLIGRMAWQRSPAVATSAGGGGSWGYWPAAIAVLGGACGLIVLLTMARNPRSRPVECASDHPSSTGSPLQDWLARAERGQMDAPAGHSDTRFNDN